jgi:chemotaxis protein CheX
MDHEFLAKSVADIAAEVFVMMLGMDIESGEAYIEQSAPTETERVVALIGVAGTWIGTGMISCSPAFACKISSRMLMTECEAVTEDVLDAMAEMANMIFGNVKTQLEEHLGSLGLSIPTVIFGRNFATRSVGKQSWTVVPIRAGTDLMELKICLAKNPDHHINERSAAHPYSIQQLL